MIRVNLLAADRPTKKKKAAGVGGGGGAPAAPGSVQAYLLLGLFTLGTIVLCAAVWWWQSNKIKKLDADIAQAEQRQRELQAIKAQVDALERKRETFQRKVDLIERLKAEQSGPVHMLDEVSKSLPDFVWLSGLDQAGDRIRFNGQSSGLTSVADFISALSPTFCVHAKARRPASASARFSSTSGTTSEIVASATRSRCRLSAS